MDRRIKEISLNKFDVLVDLLCVGISPSIFEENPSFYLEGKLKKVVSEDKETKEINKEPIENEIKQKLEDANYENPLDFTNEERQCIEGKYFFGKVERKGTEVKGLMEEDIICGFIPSNARLKRLAKLVVEFFFLVKVEGKRGILERCLDKVISIFKSHVISLKLCSEYLHLSEGDTLLFFTSKLEEIICILELISHLDVFVFICLSDEEAELYKNCSNSNFSNFISKYRSKCEILSFSSYVNYNENEKANFNFFVNTIVVSSKFKFDTQLESKFLRFLLKIAAPGGRIIFSYALDQMDFIECEIFYEKSLSVHWFNPSTCLYSQNSLGKHMHILLDVLNKFSNNKISIPSQESIKIFSFDELEKATKFALRNSNIHTVCSKL